MKRSLSFHRSRRQMWLGALAAALVSCASLTGVSYSFGRDGSSKASKTSHNVYAELDKVPPKERAKQNPLENDPDAVLAGGKLFQEHCAECHGNNAEGTREGPNLRVRQVQEAPAGSLFSILSNGVVRRGMPDWSKLPEPQRWQVVAFLKSLGASR
jgi:mono/diheme cytochrome c family protein